MSRLFVLLILSSVLLIPGCGDKTSQDSKSTSEKDSSQKESEQIKKENEQLKKELTEYKNQAQNKSSGDGENEGNIEENVERDDLILNPSASQLKNDVVSHFRNTNIQVLSVKELSRKELTGEWLSVYCEVKVKADDKEKYNYMYIKQGVSEIDATLKYKRVGANYKCDLGLSDFAKR